MYNVIIHIAVFCPGYLEWWLDSTLQLVLFLYTDSVSVAYIHMYMYVLSERLVNLSEWWLIHAEW